MDDEKPSTSKSSDPKQESENELVMEVSNRFLYSDFLFFIICFIIEEYNYIIFIIRRSKFVNIHKLIF